MTLPLYALLGFAVWTLCVPLGAVGYYRWVRIFSGTRALHSFRADGSDGADWYRRATRAHANCVENLPVFAALVFVVTLTSRGSQLVDVLCLVVLAARIVQSTIHMSFVETARSVGFRFSFYLLQMFCMLGLAGAIVAA
jgi:uncharacterized MAPEG superfamily protein